MVAALNELVWADVKIHELFPNAILPNENTQDPLEVAYINPRSMG